jgi:GntR family transcriptional regulator
MWTEKTVDRESQQKLYVQMYSIIKNKIESRAWPAGSQIPTEDELCKTYEVSKATVRMAVSELERSGFLKKLQGKGTFVTYEPQLLGVTMKTKLTENMFGEGVKASKQVLIKDTQTTSPEMKIFSSVTDAMGNASSLHYILCKRTVNGETACVEEIFIPLAVMPIIVNEDISSISLYDLIQQKSEKKIMKVVQTIEVTEIDAERASILGSRTGEPGLQLHRLLIGADSRPIAYTRLLGKGNKYKVQTEFERLK